MEVASKRIVKKFYQAKFDIELQKLNEIVKFVIESNNILSTLKSKSLEEFENQINLKSGFVSARLSAEAYGLETEYSRLLELEVLIDNKLLPKNIDASGLKKTFIEKLKEKHTSYFSSDELLLKKQLDEIISSYNKLTTEQKSNIGFNRQQQLVYAPFSNFKNN